MQELLDYFWSTKFDYQTFIPGTFGGLFNFVPVAEPKSSTAPFLRESPWTLLENKKKVIQQIPWMIGNIDTLYLVKITITSAQL